MNKLEVEVSLLRIEPDTVVIDGGVMLYKIHWPTDGPSKHMVDGEEKYIRKIFLKPDVFLKSIVIWHQV